MPQIDIKSINKIDIVLRQRIMKQMSNVSIDGENLWSYNKAKLKL